MSYLTAARPVADSRAWLVAAVCNASRRYWKARFRREERERTAGAEWWLEPWTVEQLDRLLHVRALLERLAPRKREALRLHYSEGFTALEIARAMNTSPRYAQRLISKALRDLRMMHGTRPIPAKE